MLDIQTEEKENNILVLRISEEIDEGNAEELKRVAYGAFKGGRLYLLVDLSQVEFVASAGLGAFIQMAKLAKESHGRVGLFGLKEIIRDIMRLTHLDNAISIFESEEEALQNISLCG